jgi:hypothetical protein
MHTRSLRGLMHELQVLTRGRKETAHHQRCIACGTPSFARTLRGAITFRSKHRKKCLGAEFENVG